MQGLKSESVDAKIDPKPSDSIKDITQKALNVVTRTLDEFKPPSDDVKEEGNVAELLTESKNNANQLVVYLEKQSGDLPVITQNTLDIVQKMLPKLGSDQGSNKSTESQVSPKEQSGDFNVLIDQVVGVASDVIKQLPSSSTGDDNVSTDAIKTSNVPGLGLSKNIQPLVNDVIGIAKNTLSTLSDNGDGNDDSDIEVIVSPRPLDLENIVKNSIDIVQNSLNQIEPKRRRSFKSVAKQILTSISVIKGFLAEKQKEIEDN